MRNDQLRRSGRVRHVLLGTARWGGLGLVALLALGAAYQGVSTTRDSGRFPAPGRLVEVDGRRMHILCTGQGQPTVILDAGNAGVTSTWGWIQPVLARHTRVCAYDRAGLGWSEPGESSRDAVTVAHELKALLHAAGEPGPYIHVGHSLGGIYGRVFAAEFPEDVVGLGLVDASHPEQFDRFPEEMRRQMAIYQRVMRLAPFAAAVGLVRVTNVYGRMAEGLPQRDYDRAAAMVARTRHVRTGNAEIAAWDANAARLAEQPNLGELPLVVITAGTAPKTPDGFIETHQANQRELAALSTRSHHEVLSEADHLSVLMREGHAARVTDVLRALVDTVRADMGRDDREPSTDPMAMQDIAFMNGSTRLRGHLILPAGPGPHPAFVALMGSGDGSYRTSWTEGAFPFWKDIAGFLVERGYAVMLFDKPGVNESTGDWTRQSFNDRAEEAVSAVRHLRGRHDIDPARIGLVGHSQGGWIAQIAAAHHPDDVGFLILLAGPAISVRHQIRDDVQSAWSCRAVSGPELVMRRAGLGLGLGAMSLTARVARPGYLSRIINFDPGRVLPDIGQPTLALFAEHDPLVIPEPNRERLQGYFGTDRANLRLATATVSGADHFFRDSPWCPTERPSEWARGFFEALDNSEYWRWVDGLSAVDRAAVDPVRTEPS